MSLLTICQQAARKVKKSPPDEIIGNDDAASLLAWANDVGRELVVENDFQQMKRTFSYAITGDTSRIVEGDWKPEDFYKFVPDTHYYEYGDFGYYLLGPVDDSTWRDAQIADSYINRVERFPIYFQYKNDDLLIYPKGEIGMTLYFDYYSLYWINGSDGNRKQLFENDNDTVRLSEVLVEKGIEWKYNQSEGFYDEAERLKSEYFSLLKYVKKPSYVRRRNATTVGNQGHSYRHYFMRQSL